MPSDKPTRSARRERERRKKTAKVVASLLLWIVPFVPSVQVTPYGELCVVISALCLVYLFCTAEFTVCLSTAEKAFGAWSIFLLSLCAAWIVLPSKLVQDKASALEGDLYLSSATASSKVVELGEGGTRIDFTSTDPTMLVFFKDSNLSVELDNGHLLISTEVRDQQGKVVVNVVRNHWMVNPDKSICFDKNYTADSLEVKDGRDHVVLQIRLYPDRVQLQGLWFDDKGRGRELFVDNKGYSTLFMINDPSTAEENLIRPLFKYPSLQHWAEWQKSN